MITDEDRKLLDDAQALGLYIPALSVEPVEVWVYRARRYLTLITQVCAAWNIGESDAVRILHLLADHYGIDVGTLAGARRFCFPVRLGVLILINGREFRLDQFRIMADDGMVDVWFKYLPSGWSHIDEPCFIYQALPPQTP